MTTVYTLNELNLRKMLPNKSKIKELSAAKIKSMVVKALRDNKATDIVAMNIKELTDIADYMIIATANSTVHAKALANKIITTLGPFKIKAIGVEGADTKEWVLLDFGALIVHIMLDTSRKFYELERLWQVAKVDHKGRIKNSI
jgi:ribosome-associated protein